MPQSLKHTSATEIEAFMSKPQSAQLLDIYLSAKETNGSVAEAQIEIARLNLEIQKARLDLSEHINTAHMTPQEQDELVKQHRDLWSVWRFSRWFIPISIPASVASTIGIIEILRR